MEYKLCLTQRKHGKCMKHKIIDKPEKVIDAIEEVVIGHNAERNKTILKLHYVYWHTFEEIAELMNLSDRHIRRICYEYEPKVIERLKVGE